MENKAVYVLFIGIGLFGAGVTLKYGWESGLIFAGGVIGVFAILHMATSGYREQMKKRENFVSELDEEIDQITRIMNKKGDKNDQ